MATSKDVARLAGVSHTTVSRAFRGDVQVKPQTMEKIMKAAAQLHYSPNLFASSLRQQRSRTVGYIDSHGFNPLFLNIAQAMERSLQENGYRLLISFDEGNPILQHNALRFMASAQVESVVFTPANYSSEEALQELSWMTESSIHFIQLAKNTFCELSSFYFDDLYGTWCGTSYLLKLGHRRIMMIGGAERRAGFVRAFDEIGKSPLIPFLDLSIGERNASCQMIQNFILLYKPTAIFSICEPISVLVYEALTSLNMRFPEDISLLAFDDAYWQEVLGISAVGHPWRGVAKAVVQQILTHTKTDCSSLSTIFNPFLIKRSSCRPHNEWDSQGARPLSGDGGKAPESTFV